MVLVTVTVSRRQRPTVGEIKGPRGGRQANGNMAI